MQIHCLQHIAFENPGTIAAWASTNNHSISYTYFFNQHFLLPAINSFDALLVMGGCMDTDEDEKFPWLKAEKQFIRLAIDAGKKVIGICLGAQLIAAALGAAVITAGKKKLVFILCNFPMKLYSTHCLITLPIHTPFFTGMAIRLTCLPAHNLLPQLMYVNSRHI